MAYGRRYWRRYWRRYYRGKYSSYGKTKLSKNFKASANNMTQGGTFNISVRFEDSVILNDEAAKNKEIDIGGKIAASDMHTYLSNVFDQYRIEKLTIRLKPLGDTAVNLTNPAILFTAVDRTSFANGITMAQIRTYGSYRETLVSGSKDISPTHVCYIGQSNLVEWSTYTDTKNKATFPHLIWGINYATAISITSAVSVEIDAMVRYRGVEPEPELFDANVKDFAVYNIVGNNVEPVIGVRGAQLTWVTANTSVSVGQNEMLVYGHKQGPYVNWVARWNANSASTETVPANSYYGIVQNVTTAHYFGSYEEDEIADFFSNFIEMSGGRYVNLWIQGDHMDPEIYTHWFS